jgi:hypothetical protein
VSRSTVLENPAHSLYLLPRVIDESALESALAAVRGWLPDALRRSTQARLRERGESIAALASGFSARSVEDQRSVFREATSNFRARGSRLDRWAHRLALVGGAARACWEEEPGGSEYAVALGMLNGRVVVTGSDTDSLMATALAAVAAAQTRFPAHVLCADAATLERLTDRLAPLCDRLGLKLGVVASDKQPDQRREAYRADVVCGRVQLIIHDALHDLRTLVDRPSDLRLRLEHLHAARPRSDSLLQRGLASAFLVDADALLLDRALGSFALAGDLGGNPESEALSLAFDTAALLSAGTDYDRNHGGRPILSPEGRGRLSKMLSHLGGSWSVPDWRESVLELALLARYHLEPHRDYRVHPDGIELSDGIESMVDTDYAGRLLTHLLAIRHGQPIPTGAPEASMSHMGCFLRYHSLSGTMGQCDSTARRDLWNLYRVATTDLSAGRSGDAISSVVLPVRSDESGMDEIAALVQAGGGLPLLLTRSEEVAAAIVARLRARGLDAELLDEYQGAVRPDARPGAIVCVGTVDELMGDRLRDVGDVDRVLLLDVASDLRQA